MDATADLLNFVLNRVARSFLWQNLLPVFTDAIRDCRQTLERYNGPRKPADPDGLVTAEQEAEHAAADAEYTEAAEAHYTDCMTRLDGRAVPMWPMRERMLIPFMDPDMTAHHFLTLSDTLNESDDSLMAGVARKLNMAFPDLVSLVHRRALALYVKNMLWLAFPPEHNASEANTKAVTNGFARVLAVYHGSLMHVLNSRAELATMADPNGILNQMVNEPTPTGPAPLGKPDDQTTAQDSQQTP